MKTAAFIEGLVAFCEGRHSGAYTAGLSKKAKEDWFAGWQCGDNFVKEVIRSAIQHVLTEMLKGIE
jgi:hypothetical protein